MNQSAWVPRLHRTVQLRGTSQPFPHRSGMASCSVTPCAAPYVRPVASRLFFAFLLSAEPRCCTDFLRGFSNLVPEEPTHHGQSRPKMPRTNMKGPRLGPGPFPVREWLTAYSRGDVNRHEELEKWRSGDDGWINQAPKAYGLDSTLFGSTRVLT